MKICKSCGNELLDEVTVCPTCGSAVESDVESNFAEPQPTKKKGKFKTIIITIAVIVIARLVGGLFGEFLAKDMVESSQKNDIEEFIERMEEYVPGHIKGNEYVSEKFGFRFAIDEKWEFYSDEDLKKASENVKAGALTSALETLEKEGVSQELKDKFEKSIYAATEMGALYIADDMYVGEVSVGVMYAYGIEDVTVDDYVNEVKNGLNMDMQVSDEYIAGSNYKVLSAKITDVSGINTVVKMYTKIEDDVICMITCRAVEGYEESVFNAFEDRISAYK